MGVASKLWSGGGEEVIHSMLRASHGSAPAGGFLRLAITLTTKVMKDAAMTSDPMLTTRFQKFQPIPSA